MAAKDFRNLMEVPYMVTNKDVRKCTSTDEEQRTTTMFRWLKHLQCIDKNRITKQDWLPGNFSTN